MLVNTILVDGNDGLCGHMGDSGASDGNDSCDGGSDDDTLETVPTTCFPWRGAAATCG